MAIDSELKRKSVAATGNVALPISIVPNATPGNAERQTIGWSYSGISAAGVTLSAQWKGLFRMVHARIFGRVN